MEMDKEHDRDRDRGATGFRNLGTEDIRDGRDGDAVPRPKTEAEIDADIVRAVQYGDQEFVANLVVRSKRNEHLVLTAARCNRLWLLHWAAVNNRVQIAELLLNNGLVSTGKGGSGDDGINLPAGELNETALQWAVRNDAFTYMVKLLLDHGADISHKNANGHDALSIACIFGNIHMAYIL
jgi:ankyrin repeat protein